LAQADRYKDDYFEKPETTEVDKAFLRGQLHVIDDVVGLVSFMKMFKEQK
jgi:hypothetical protein